MDDAFDTVRNQRVWATEATISRFPDHYICPLCRTEVILASGPIVRDHFRHLRGTDHDECERYSKNFGREVPLSQHEYEHLDAVLVASRTPGKDGGRVVFAVRFRPAKQKGRLKLTGQVEFVSGGHSTSYAIRPDLKQQYFRITTAESSYLINAKLTGGGQAKYPVEGFGESPAVFRNTDGEAVRVPKHRLLKPGGHIVVSRKPIPNFHTSLATQALSTMTGLHAALIEIPENPTWQLRQDVKSILGFEITWKLATYGFLSPAGAYELAPDCWEIPRDSELAILIRMASGSSVKFTRLLVQHRVSGHLTTEYLPLRADQKEFVIGAKIGSWRPDLLRIGLATSAAMPVWFLLEISFSEDAVSPQCARIQFQFATPENLRTRLKWSAHELPKMLMDAARGPSKLLAITSKPEAVELTASDSEGRRVTIPEAGAAEKLVSFLHAAQYPCVVSASGHPDLTLKREKAIVNQIRTVTAPANAIPRSRRGARLQDAFARGHASEYTLRTVTL